MAARRWRRDGRRGLRGGVPKPRGDARFCHPDCWASYNAAKRLVALGYSQVYWYPAGMEGWQDRHDTAVVKPDKTWLSTLPKSLTQ